MMMQDRVTEYWQDEHQSYDRYIHNELAGSRRQRWRALLDANRPAGDALEILDLGTGPGFFPLLLGGTGHHVTAVDCSENMLGAARANASAAGLTDVELVQMDSHDLTFPDDSFDLALCRNATWLLHDPVAAYRCWYRVLRRGGRLLVFDGNWYTWIHDPVQRARVESDEAEAPRAGHAETEQRRREGEQIGSELFLSSRQRPHWDVPVLLDVGFSSVYVERDITDVAFDDDERIRLRSMPMFLIRAEK